MVLRNVLQWRKFVLFNADKRTRSIPPLSFISKSHAYENIFAFSFLTLASSAQITTPIIKAAFGVDGDLRANYFNGFVQSGNDDWFNNGTAGTGFFVIDTTGAASVVAGYLSDVSPFPRRMKPLFRSMSRPKFTVINNR